MKKIKRLIERPGKIWFEFKHGYHRVYVTDDYWADGLKFWEFVILDFLNRFTKHRPTIQ